MTTSRIGAAAIALTIAFGSVGGGGSTPGSATDQKLSGTIASFALLMESTTGWRHTASTALYRQPHGQKQMAVSMRCVRA
jgi:hypothetical protein